MHDMYFSPDVMTFGRRLKCMALSYKRMKSGVRSSAQDVAGEILGRQSTTYQTMSEFPIATRANVPGFGTGSGEAGSTHVGPDMLAFQELTGKLSAFDRIDMQSVSPNTQIVANTSAATAAFVGESKALPAAAWLHSKTRIPSYKLGAIGAGSEEFWSDMSDEATRNVLLSFARAVAKTVDVNAFDSSNAGSAIVPAALTYNAVTLVSSGDPADDLRLLVANYSGDLSTACLIMPSIVAGQMALRSPGGLAMELGVRGGRVVQIPVYCTQQEGVMWNSDAGQIAILDENACSRIDLGLEVDFSANATIEMNSTPAGATDTPTGMASPIVSMFAEDAVAVKVSRRIGWLRSSQVDCVLLTGVDYTAA